MDSKDGLEEELARLKIRLADLERTQAAEIKDLRSSIIRLEQGKASAEDIQKVVSPPRLPRSTEPIPSRPATPPPVPAAQAPVAETPTPAPALPATIEPAPLPKQEKGAVELQIGRVWLVRIGVVLLVTGLVLLGNYAYQNWIRDLSAGVRLAALYLSAFGITGTGWWLARGERMEKFGEVLIAGGMAFFYWCTFASHQVERLRVIESPVVAGLLLLGSAALILTISIRRKTPLTAMMGILMASYATTLQPVGWLAAASNLMLTAGGVFLMRRPGWGRVGAIGMVGIYASFFWWNLAGAAGGDLHPSGIGFVAASWALFALPGVVGLAGRFEGTFSARGLAWFVGINNAACFGLISLLWLALEYDAYWQVPTVFGLLLVALGALSRNRNAGSSTQLSQGIALLTMALLLKLQGYQLAAGLALEAVALAGAFWRFRRLPELAFSLLAMVGSVLLVFGEASTTTLSGGIVALLLAVATGLWCSGATRVEKGGTVQRIAGFGSIAGLAGASVVAFFGWILRLDLEWQAGLSAFIGLGLSSIYLLGGGRRWLPQIHLAATAFSVAAVVLMPLHLGLVGSLTYSAVATCAVAAAMLWERCSGHRGIPPITWLHALTFPLAMGIAIYHWDLGNALSLMLLAGAVPGMVLAFRWIKFRSLVVGSSLMLIVSLIFTLELGINQSGYGFLTTASALLALTFATYGGKPGWAGEKAVHGITRTLAVLTWLWAWTNMFDPEWVEIIPLTTLAIWLATRKLGLSNRPPEVLVLSVVSAMGFLISLATATWHHQTVPSISPGLGFVVSLGAVTFAPALVGVTHRHARRLIQGAFAVSTALWSTQAMATCFGWQAMAILWTTMGFAYVSVGLWRRMATLRHLGFALLTLSLAKLFLVDVWAFETFTRVMAFIALGVALVVLGFFYNHFATILKRLLASEEEETPPIEADHSTP